MMWGLTWGAASWVGVKGLMSGSGVYCPLANLSAPGATTVTPQCTLFVNLGYPQKTSGQMSLQQQKLKSVIDPWW
jgi:hypothetical protein